MAWLLGGTGTVVLCAAGVAPDAVGSVERAVFRAVNDLPGWLYPIVWLPMQYGTFITIPLAAVAAVVMRRVRLAVELLASGVGVWLLAKVVKDLAPRARPGALLDEVALRGVGAGGRGFPSGHAAVAAALAFVLVAWLPGRWKLVPVALGAAVCFGRVYVGAHLPLDVIGGAGLGIAAGAVATLLGGVPAPTGSGIAEDVSGHLDDR